MNTAHGVPARQPLSVPLSVNDIAHICHDANRALCLSQGDFSQHIWENAPEWQRESARCGVQFALDHPEATPEMMHASWCRHKAALGWRHGAEKNEEKRTHPCLVPYAKLPPAQIVKDVLFQAIVAALIGEEEASDAGK